jgi:hypothetical protein
MNPSIKETEDIKADPNEDRFGYQFNFNNLLRVRGEKGKLFTPCSKVQKNGMVGVMEFMNFGNKKTVKAVDCIALSSYIFYHEAGKEPLKMDEVISNLHEFNEANEDKFKQMCSVGDKELMEIMVPNYDPQMFKGYHMAQIIEWYNILLDKLETIKESERDDTKTVPTSN